MKFLQFLFSYLYKIIICSRNWLYDNRIIKINNFDTPIISIGNITMGGSAKTPMTIYLAEKLINKNYSIGIVSRGYKRATTGTFVVSDGIKVLGDANTCGDEPYIISKKVPNAFIVVDENKSRAVKLIINKYNPDIILLDDGFQHRKIARSIDLLLINSTIHSNYYKLLPYGLLREPLKNINRSNIIITTYGNIIDDTININPNISIYNSNMKYSIKQLVGSNLTDCKKPINVVAFCGIANPKIFFEELDKLELNVIKKITLPNHVKYSNKIIKKLRTTINNNNIKSIITTEKDLVKLPISLLNTFNIYTLCMEVYIDNEDKIIDEILCNIKSE